MDTSSTSLNSITYDYHPTLRLCCRHTHMLPRQWALCPREQLGRCIILLHLLSPLPIPRHSPSLHEYERPVIRRACSWFELDDNSALRTVLPTSTEAGFVLTSTRPSSNTTVSSSSSSRPPSETSTSIVEGNAIQGHTSSLATIPWPSRVAVVLVSLLVVVPVMALLNGEWILFSQESGRAAAFDRETLCRFNFQEKSTERGRVRGKLGALNQLNEGAEIHGLTKSEISRD